VSLLDEVLDGQPAAQHVVDGDRAQGAGARRAVHHDDRDAAPAHLVEGGGVGVHRGDQDALDALLHQAVQVHLLALGAAVAVADEQRQVGVLGGGLDALGDVVEERVGAVQHHVREGAAGAGAQLAGRLVAHETELQHRPFDPFAGARGDHLGAVHHIGHGAQRHPGRCGDVLDRRRPAVERLASRHAR
jgi:hypothetical protein